MGKRVQIFESVIEPKDTNVLWLNGDSIKKYIKGKWRDISDGAMSDYDIQYIMSSWGLCPSPPPPYGNYGDYGSGVGALSEGGEVNSGGIGNYEEEAIAE